MTIAVAGVEYTAAVTGTLGRYPGGYRAHRHLLKRADGRSDTDSKHVYHDDFPEVFGPDLPVLYVLDAHVELAVGYGILARHRRGV